MRNNNDKWGALSIKDRASLIDMYLKSGIKELSEMKKHYNGVHYRDLNTSDYDYFNASPEMIPTKEGQHWDSRNPHTGQILKREDHPTFDLAVEGEKNAGYKIVRGYNGELYSIPNTPDNYVENYNSFGAGGDTDGDGNIVLDWIRKQLYDKIDPVGYNQFVDRVKAAILGKGEDKYNKVRDDIFATYLKIPKDERHNVKEAKKVSDATYTPTKSSENSTYHKIDLTDKEKDALIYDALRSNANVGDNYTSHVFEHFFGPHQVGRGKDEKGEYVSYYDLWDLDPSSGESKTGEFEFLKSLQKILGAKDMSLGVGEPVEFYDRIYLNDYYGVTPQIDEGVTEGGYLQPAYIEASTVTGSTFTGEDYYDAGEESLPQYKCGGRLNKFGNGTSDKYNVFNDKNAFTARDIHINSLKEFIKNNPEIKGLKTNDFFEFFSQLAGLESTYNSLAGEKMKYNGLYGLEGGRNYDINTQHKKAYEHLAKLFKSSIVQEDLQKGLELGYTPAQILAKYWNQGNRVTNFLHRGVDNQDGVGTNISDYGWNMTANVDYNKYLQKGITDDYVIVKPGVYLSNVALKSRNDDVDYSDATKSIINLNTKVKQHNTKNKDAKFDTSRLQVGDTIWLKKPPYLK